MWMDAIFDPIKSQIHIEKHRISLADAVFIANEKSKQINEGIKRDSDTDELSDKEFTQLNPAKMGQPKAEETKIPISIRLSPEVINAFKSKGRGWQTRIDNALKEWLEQH